MAHQIDTTTGQPAVFTVGTPPWHGLGVNIQQAVNSRKAIELARLDWQVERFPIHASNPVTWQTSPVPDRVATVRTDTRAVLGVVGRDYHVFQNVEAFDFMDAIVGDKLAMYETAGALRGGRIIWMLARIPREYHATPDDPIHPYVLLVNSHDGTTSLRMIPTSVRVVCQNTLNLALGRGVAGEGIAIRHRPSLDDRVREARQKLGLIAARFDRFDDELHRMLDRQLKLAELRRYFDTLLPPVQTPREEANRKQTLETFQSNFENSRNTLRGMRNSAWAAYNAVSEWADHQRRFRGRDDQHRAENRLNSIWFGSSNLIKQRAHAQALQLALSC